MKTMTWDHIRDLAFLNTDALEGPPRGVVLNFHGYTDDTMFSQSDDFARRLGEQGILYIWPYYSVWAWMSRSAIAYIEELLDLVWEHFELDGKTPVVYSGGSMGGMTALMMSLIGKRRPIACACNCPATDLAWRFERHDSRRAVTSAMILDEGTPQEWISLRSPQERAADLPHIPYYLLYAADDTAILPRERVAFLTAMADAGQSVETVLVPGMAHCDLASHPQAEADYQAFILRQFS